MAISKFPNYPKGFRPLGGITINLYPQSLTGTVPTPSNGNMSGSGSPEGVVTATVGARYYDTTGSTHWVKHSGTGNTGWAEFIA